MSLPRLFKPFQQVHGASVHRLLDLWFDTELGAELLAQEQCILDRLLPSLFGYYLVQTGIGRPQDLARSSTIHRKVYCSGVQPGEPGHTEGNPDTPDLQPEQPGATSSDASYYRRVCSSLEDLALATESVDVAVLHHSLDFDSAPHRALREIARAVIPGGHIVIVGFNPWSLWGLCRFFLMQNAGMPWSGNFISPYRLSDWIKLLDFQVEGYESTGFGLPTANRRSRRLFNWVSYLGQRIWRQRGGVYVLVAVKQVSTLTPIKPRFQSVKETLANIPIAGIPKPTARKQYRAGGGSE